MKVTVLVASQRCGTTALTQCLGSHVSLGAYGEVFDNRTQQRPENYFAFLKASKQMRRQVTKTGVESRKLFDAYVDHLAKLSGAPQILFGAKYNSLHHFNPVWHGVRDRPFLIDLIKETEARVLHITRKNLLARIVSEKLAVMRGEYHSEEAVEIAPSSVVFDIGNLLERLRRERATIRYLRTALSNVQCLELAYEDLFAEGRMNAKTFGSIAEWMELGSPDFSEPRLKKITANRKLSEIVGNAEEVEAGLRDGGFESFVSGPDWR